MQSSPKLQGYPLPAVLHPTDTVCFEVRVPNDPAYISAFIGALYDTTLWISWQRDSAKRGVIAAQEMKKVWFDTVFNPNACKDCPPPQNGGLLEDFEMPLRVDCDCNVFVTCCDGTEKQILTADQVRVLIQQQPGTGAQQPTPGGCTTYQGTLQGNGKFLVPTVVNTGDVITVLSANGLTNDGTEVPWRDFAGDQIFAGINVGGQFTQGTDLLPSAFHDAILVQIGSTYYPAYTPFTVPGGVVNAQPVLLLNTTNASAMSGSMDLSVQVCNNQSPNWSSTFDFTTSPYSALMSSSYGNWTPGVGYEGLPGTGQTSTIVLEMPCASTTSVSAQLTYSADGTGAPSNQVYVADSAGFITSHNPPIVGTNTVLVGGSGHSGVTNFEIAIGLGSAGTQCSIAKLVINGTGAKPVGWP